MSDHTRVLGIDFGTKRIGAALSDPRRKISSPLETYERRDQTQDARHYRKLIVENEISLIVIGLPIHNSGQEGASAKKARDWGTWLSAETCVKVVYHDERFSTVEAEEKLLIAGVKRKGRKERVDMLAAQILLQDFLDQGCPELEAANQSMADSGEPV
jgi:putative Holliday junction resolvase